MNFRNSSAFKKCPRCKEKCLVHAKKCHDCGLIFERLNYTSNKTAKKNLLKGRRDEVIMVKEWPWDAKKSTALLLCGFLGFSGAHNFYLGRFFKALFVLLGLLLAVVMVVLSDLGLHGTLAEQIIRYIATLPGASVLILWFSDFVSIFLERYKIPVSIDGELYKIRSGIVSSDEKNSKEKTVNKKEEVNKSKPKSLNNKKKYKENKKLVKEDKN